MIHLTHPDKKNNHMGQQDQGRGLVLHFQEEVYQLTLTFRRRVARYLKWSPFTHSAQKIDQVDSENKDMW